MSQFVSVIQTDGNSHCVFIKIDTTVLDVKRVLEKELQIEERRFDLSYEGCILQNITSLLDLGINNGDELTMSLSSIGEALTKLGSIPATANSLLWESHKGGFKVLWLLKAGVAIDCRGSDFRTPLLLACQHGRSATAKLLIKHGADINICDTNGVTPLLFSCLRDLVDVAFMLLQNGASPTCCSLEGTTPLLCAVRRSCPEMVKQLLNEGVTTNDVDNHKWTSLMYACSSTTSQGEQNMEI